MADYEGEIRKIIHKLTKLDEEKIILEVPKNPEHGDYAFPCFILSRETGENPVHKAKELAALIKPSGNVISVSHVGPYINFKVNKTALIGETIKNIFKEKDEYGSAHSGKWKKALVEHTSVNPNASPHVGRARNAMIGDSIARLLKFEGYKTEVHYLVNDVGKQIAMLVIGCAGRKDVTFHNLLDIYIEISKEAENNPEIEKQIFEKLNKLENGDKKVRQDFENVVKICIDGQKEILEEFGIKYDSFDHESVYLWDKKTQKVLDKLGKTKKIFTDEEKRIVLDLKEHDIPMETPVLVLTRADGTSLYPLRDLAYNIDKLSMADHNYVVLGEDHKLYFAQIAAALKMLGHEPPKVIHYAFVLLNEGKMSTRKGNVVLLEEFMKEAKDKAKFEIKKRHGDVHNLEELSKVIAYGAVKYAILRVSPEKNVVFDWDSALSFEGDSGPYIQYSHARIASILAKYEKKVPQNADFTWLKDAKELALANKLADFQNVVSKAVQDLRPNAIANYACELAQRFNEFYHTCPILQAPSREILEARLALAAATKQVLRNALYILGIDAPDKM